MDVGPTILLLLAFIFGQTESRSCGVYTSNSGVVTSRNYPSPYPNSERCEYVIRLPSGSRMEIYFNDYVTENGYDYFQFTAGVTDLNKYSGTAHPARQESTTNEIRFKFTSDGSVNKKGWKLTYRKTVNVNDGQWASWLSWGGCNANCGPGYQVRARTCTNPAPSGDGAYCTGSMYTTRACQGQPCPVNGSWSDWTEWGNCSISCGGGQHNRTRTCDNPSPGFGGRNCSGPDIQNRQCNEFPCPVDGQWSPWLNWTSCPTSCGSGRQIRSRLCSNPVPANGGRPCSGVSFQESGCNNFSCPVDGRWSVWSHWSTCSTSCGTGNDIGIHNRTRYCNNPQPAFGGRNCSGDWQQIQSCNDRICPIDGGWSSWRDWSMCSKSCGQGTRYRTKNCSNPSPSFSGQYCNGDSFEDQICNNFSCPIDGHWSEWSSLSDCSKSCGGGHQIKTRSCNNPTPSFGGQNCTGENSTSQACNMFDCPIHGNWSIWTNWTTCTKSCGGGNQQRSRSCSNPSPTHGGSPCSGSSFQVQVCNNSTCPVDGCWSVWSIWSNCSQPCGDGEQKRTRECDNPPPAFDGRNCSGSWEESQHCNDHECPIDGLWSSWFDWSTCSKSCGGGNKVRSRSCSNPSPAHGGRFCPDVSFQGQECEVSSCPLNGGWSPWSPWSICGVSCGGGQQNRTRTCSNPAPLFGGENCPGESTQYQQCNEIVCPIDGKWSPWRNWIECSKSCGFGKQTRYRECNTPAAAYGGRYCSESSYESRGCNEFACPIHGNWSPWSLFTSCSVTCGDGFQSKTRTCNDPSPSFGGLNCSGGSAHTRVCREIDCPIDGQWGAWENWAECTKTCGTGRQLRQRACNNPPPAFGGRYCVGKELAERKCNEAMCPSHGNWTEWGHWGVCSTSCGRGSNSRSRSCSNPSPSFGGESCNGTSLETKHCDYGSCPTAGLWSGWSTWTNCSRSCEGGNQIRQRECTNPPPSFGGKYCLGLSHDSHECNTLPCPVDGQWASWQEWDSCSQSCGGGQQSRTRTCSSPTPTFGGANCSGSPKEQRFCGNSHCPVDGQWSKWFRWTHCSKQCGLGFQERSRSCSSPMPSFGGSQCVGNENETRVCNGKSDCSTETCKVWSDWSSWSKCSLLTCNHIRERACNASDSFKSSETKTCNQTLLHKCEQYPQSDDKIQPGKAQASKGVEFNYERNLIIPIGGAALVVLVVVLVVVLIRSRKKSQPPSRNSDDTRDTLPLSQGRWKDMFQDLD